jgi:hypothetical protein
VVSGADRFASRPDHRDPGGIDLRYVLGLVAVVLLAACGLRSPVKDTVVIEPDDVRRHVAVTARTEIADNGKDASENARLVELRAAIVDHRDAWTARFATVNPESERATYEKSRGLLRRAERTVRMTVDDLQRLLSDCGTIQITDGDHWTELALYPSSSTRATRQQREHVELAMHTFSADVVRYLRALDRLYSYLDHAPDRATPVFIIFLSDKEERSTIEEEDALLTEVDKAMDRIIDHVDEAKKQGVTLDEEFDLVFNPLPGEIVVRLPSPILSSEGFERRDERTVAIPRAALTDAIASLEGRWASPDPLAIIARASDTNTDMPKPAEVAARPRHSTPTVTVDEVEKALAARVRPAAAYRVRW